MIHLIVLPAALSVLIGCSTPPQLPAAPTTIPLAGVPVKPALFSAGQQGALPAGWGEMILLRTKAPTSYRVVADGNQTVLHAKAAASASGLMYKLERDVAETPYLHWRWKVPQLIKSADNAHQGKEDSPVRIVLAFDGDKESLPFKDQMTFEMARTLTGQDMPYATLMYIWENRLPVGTVIPNSRTGRVQMIVAASGADGLGEWRSFDRNIAEDYEKAFGEKPGKLIGVGVLTDTDNTGETIEAWYGDIRLLPLPLQASNP